MDYSWFLILSPCFKMNNAMGMLYLESQKIMIFTLVARSSLYTGSIDTMNFGTSVQKKTHLHVATCTVAILQSVVVWLIFFSAGLTLISNETHVLFYGASISLRRPHNAPSYNVSTTGMFLCSLVDQTSSQEAISERKINITFLNLYIILYNFEQGGNGKW